MTSPSQRYYVVGDETLRIVRDEAPERVRRIVSQLTEVLAQGPYPGSPLLHATRLRAFLPDHYICWYDDVVLGYRVLETAPVRLVLLVNAVWVND